jgi:hypothetical protein
LNVFILDTKEDILEFQELIKEKTNNKIIASSIESHQYLKKIGIIHDLVDDYFTKFDYRKIDTTTNNFTLNWYKQEGKKLEFNGLQIGYVSESQMHQFFLQVVRRFFCVKIIIDKIKPKKIFVGSLSSLAKTITKNDKIEIIEKIMKKEIDLELDKLEIPLPFIKSHGLKISRKNYFRLKNFIEKIIVSTSKLPNDSKKSILILDLNPVYFPDLLAKLAKNFDDIFLLNQRRPAIWNLESLRLVKKGNYKVLRLENFNDDSIETKITKKQAEFIEKVNYVKTKSEFNEFFKIENIDLWEIIKEDFIEIIKNLGKDMIHKNILIQELLHKLKISMVFEWAYTGFEERIVNHEADKKKKPIVFLQHSIIAENSKYDDFLPFQPTLPQNNDRVAVYGNEISEFIKTKNISENNIILSGSPRHDIFFNTKSNTKNENTIVIATSSAFSIYNADGNDIKSYKKWEKTMYEILNEIKKYPNKKPIIKLHPSKEYYDIKSFLRKIDKKIPIYKDQKAIDFLKNCDILIVTNFSTILLEAMILGKPTIMISTQNQNLDEEPIVKNHATLYISEISEIGNGINKIINDSKFRNELIKNANNYIDRYFINQGQASDYLAKELGRIV